MAAQTTDFMNSAKTLLVLATCAIGVAACGNADETRDKGTRTLDATETVDELSANQITGTVTYRERIALSPEAELNLRLEDVSLADTAAKLIAERNMAISGEVPISFKLNYDPALIKESNSYAIRAKIFDRGRLLFTTDTHHPVLTRNGGNTINLVLRHVPNAAPNKADLANTDWVLTSINGEPIPEPQNVRPAYLRLTAEGNIVHGFSGCNQFSGTWQRHETGVSFGALAMTMMACPDAQDIEERFMPELEKINRYEIDGQELILFQDEQELLRFKEGG